MTKQKATAATAQIDGLDEKDLVTLKLAHPLNDLDKQRLGLPQDSSTGTGDEIKVRASDARTIITAGYAQVDPEDNVAVAEALGETVPPEAEPAKGPAQGDK